MSVFDRNRSKGKMFSFGINREAYSKVYIKAHPAPDLAIPGPGTYNVVGVPGKNARKYTMRPQTAGNLIASPSRPLETQQDPRPRHLQHPLRH
jgi:hypothetical protein